MHKKELFVSCIVGLEDILETEITTLGYTSRKGFGGVYVQTRSFDDVYILNLHLRSASRVFIPLLTFECYDKEDLYREVKKFNWKPFFSSMPSFAIDHVVKHKEFSNSLFAARVVKDALCDMLREAYGKRPDVDTKFPDIRLHLFIDNNTATISFDSSGEPLHQRGYRQEAGEAPLRESLAAALLKLGGYTGAENIIDPCCGSATFLIEAAMIATNRAPGILRKFFGFMKHPEFKRDAWEKVLQKAYNDVRPLKNKIYGIEEHPKTYQAALKAIRQAGFSNVIHLIQGDFREANIPDNINFVICNPPYGVRIRPKEMVELQDLYRSIGDFMKRNTVKPAKGLVLTASADLAKCIGLKTTKRHIVNNGGIDCRLLEYDLY